MTRIIIHNHFSVTDGFIETAHPRKKSGEFTTAASGRLSEFVKLGKDIGRAAWGGKNIPKSCAGACAATSYALMKRMRAEGHPAHLVLGSYNRDGTHSKHDKLNQHAWVESEGKIIDVTHGQFNQKKPIIITDKNDPRYVSRKRDDAAYKDVMRNWYDEFKPSAKVYESVGHRLPGAAKASSKEAVKRKIEADFKAGRISMRTAASLLTKVDK